MRIKCKLDMKKNYKNKFKFIKNVNQLVSTPLFKIGNKIISTKIL